MNAAVLLIIAAVIFYLGFRIYGKYIAGIFEENDKNQTKILREAAAFFDISLLDHLIIAGDSYYSFADEGLMGF